MRTWGDITAEFMECKTKEEAKKWLEKEVARMVEEHKMNPIKATKTLLSSLGYMMGYYSDEEAARMQKLLDLTHPILPWVGKEPTTPENLNKAYRAGLNHAQKSVPSKSRE